MADVAVRRLRVRGPAERTALAAFRIEDGCRTAIDEAERLVLLRRLRLPAAATDAHPMRRGQAIAGAWSAATARARHGGADRAGESECVWFASGAEARRLLLALLLAGRTPRDWFWRLAVPGWEGAPLASFVRSLVADAVRARDGAALPRLAVQLAEAGRSDLLIEALGATAPGGWSVPPPLFQPPLSALQEEQAPPRVGEKAPAIAEAVESLRARLPTPLRQMIEEIVRSLALPSRPRRQILEALLRTASPDLVLMPGRLSAFVEVYEGLLRTAATSDRRPLETASRRDEDISEKVEAVSAGQTGKAAEAPAPPPAPAGSRSVALSPPAVRASDPESVPINARHPFSAAAGVWLALPLLIRAGWREWLLARPDLIGTDPGRSLLAALAAHHRVAWEDPAIAPLAFVEPPPAPPWADAWRRALGRHLRRQARLSLRALIWRPGRIAWEEDRLVVRFPLAAVDVRLRRRALDADPGWVDWLGLSVRYLFVDEAAR